MKWLKNNWFKLLAVAVLFGALGTHPYAYYQILRWVVCLASAYTAYLYYQSKNMALLWLFVAMAILFNPIAPIYMSRNTWQTFDVIAAVIFIVSLFSLRSVKKHND
jgi:FtsH-binding integral membrane protein